jgi:hypothetical protein
MIMNRWIVMIWASFLALAVLVLLAVVFLVRRHWVSVSRHPILAPGTGATGAVRA